MKISLRQILSHNFLITHPQFIYAHCYNRNINESIFWYPATIVSQITILFLYNLKHTHMTIYDYL